ncbi:DUF3017 domain-containing protein [Parasphingorhabdus pacifica]
MSERSAGGSRMSVHVPFVLVAFVVLSGLVWVGMRHWREGTVLIGGALMLAALLRAMLPEDRVGMLGVRSRVVDVLLFGGLGLLIAAVSVTITGESV